METGFRIDAGGLLKQLSQQVRENASPNGTP
jgi:hypothetical protein